MNNKPESPLPWVAFNPWEDKPTIYYVGPKNAEVLEACILFAKETDQDAAYIAHAANAYPRLVQALKQFSQCDLNESNCASLEVATRRINAVATQALRELGEDA